MAEQSKELLEALSRRDAAEAAALIRSGAAVGGCDERGRTPLYLAAGSGFHEVAQLLLERGAEVDARAEDKSTMTPPETPLHAGARMGHREVVELLLQHRADVKAVNTHEATALHIATAAGHREVVGVLLDNGADVQARGWGGSQATALHLAAYHGHQAVAELLLERGAAIDERRDDGRTPLHRALEDAHPELAELLIARGADVNARDVNDWTPLHFAVSRGLGTAALLLARGADIQARARSFGTKCGYRDATLLHVAAAWGKAEMVDLLVQRRRELLDARAARGKRPLHAAAENGHAEVVERLLRHGADASAADEEGKTALDRAREAEDRAIVELLSRPAPPA